MRKSAVNIAAMSYCGDDNEVGRRIHFIENPIITDSYSKALPALKSNDSHGKRIVLQEQKFAAIFCCFS
jgi:hypothetical protein